MTKLTRKQLKAQEELQESHLESWRVIIHILKEPHPTPNTPHQHLKNHILLKILASFEERQGPPKGETGG